MSRTHANYDETVTKNAFDFTVLARCLPPMKFCHLLVLLPFCGLFSCAPKPAPEVVDGKSSTVIAPTVAGNPDGELIDLVTRAAMLANGEKSEAPAEPMAEVEVLPLPEDSSPADDSATEEAGS